MAIREIVIAVSYTHLDVYKRQGKTFFAAAYGIFFSHRCNAYRVRSLWNDSCAALFMERA